MGDDEAGSALSRPEIKPLALNVRERTRYEIIAEHGRGGLGTVSRANDTELGRHVAIKEMLRRGDVAEIRFLREALITARLEHPGIVPIHEAGRWPDGTPFYVMKLVSGSSLKELIARCKDVPARLELLHHVLAVADAIGYAHRRKIIHRDLKPANVIVGDFGETIVIDWGLAKDLNDKHEIPVEESAYRTHVSEELTRADHVVGTPLYMAPEQCRGEEVDQRADVFAIGAMLWELCSLIRIPPTNPRQRDRMLRRNGIDADLSAILAKALEQDPHRRYRDAGELATDLKAFRSGTRVAARRYSLLAVLAHWTRHHRALSSAIAITVAVLAIVGVSYVRTITRERDRADRALVSAEQSKTRADARGDALLLENIKLVIETNPTEAAALLDTYRGSDLDLKNRLLAKARGLGIARVSATPHTGPPMFAGVTPTGGIVTLFENEIAITRDGLMTKAVNDVQNFNIRHNRDYSRIVYTTTDNKHVVIDLENGGREEIPHQSHNRSLSPNGKRIAVGDSGHVYLYEAFPLRLAAKSPAVKHDGLVEFVTNDRVIIAQGNEQTIVHIDANSKISMRSVSGRHELGAALRQADGKLEASAIVPVDGNLVWLDEELAEIASLRVCATGFRNDKFSDHVVLSRQAPVIAFGCNDGSAGVVRAHEHRLERLRTFEARNAALYLDDSGSRIFILSDSTRTRFLDIETGIESVVLSPHVMSGAVWNEDKIVTMFSNGSIQLYQAPRSTARVVRPQDDLDAVFWGDFAPNSSHFIGSGHRNFSNLDVQTGKLYTEACDYRCGNISLLYGQARFNRTKPTFAIWGRLAPVRLLDLSNRITRAWNSTARTSDASFIDEESLAVTMVDGSLRRLRVASEDVLFSHSTALSEVETVSGGIVFTSNDGRMWKHRSDHSTVEFTIPRPSKKPTVLQASNDARKFALGIDSGEVYIYDADNGGVIDQFRANEAVTRICFFPDDATILGLTRSGDIVVHYMSANATRLSWTRLAIGARDIDVSQDGELIGISAVKGDTWFYRVGTREWIFFRDQEKDLFTGRFSSDGRWFVSLFAGFIVRDVEATLRTHANP